MDSASAREVLLADKTAPANFAATRCSFRRTDRYYGELIGCIGFEMGQQVFSWATVLDNARCQESANLLAFKWCLMQLSLHNDHRGKALTCCLDSLNTVLCGLVVSSAGLEEGLISLNLTFPISVTYIRQPGRHFHSPTKKHLSSRRSSNHRLPSVSFVNRDASAAERRFKPSVTFTIIRRPRSIHRLKEFQTIDGRQLQTIGDRQTREILVYFWLFGDGCEAFLLLNQSGLKYVIQLREERFGNANPNVDNEKRRLVELERGGITERLDDYLGRECLMPLKNLAFHHSNNTV
ncbi:kinesin light chain [Striga asiatica]|uniref:Kinesin light chain n=1 Tax=Striga asiatica TaxID=4170 RepID=A0A5A7R072_STRAF|nr:kinesin light chain [Striga asiatica]